MLAVGPLLLLASRYVLPFLRYEFEYTADLYPGTGAAPPYTATIYLELGWSEKDAVIH